MCWLCVHHARPHNELYTLFKCNYNLSSCDVAVYFFIIIYFLCLFSLVVFFFKNRFSFRPFYFRTFPPPTKYPIHISLCISVKMCNIIIIIFFIIIILCTKQTKIEFVHFVGIFLLNSKICLLCDKFDCKWQKNILHYFALNISYGTIKTKTKKT